MTAALGSAERMATWPRDQKSRHQEAVSEERAVQPLATAASRLRRAAAAMSSFGSKVAALAIRMVMGASPARVERRTSVSLAMRAAAGRPTTATATADLQQ